MTLPVPLRKFTYDYLHVRAATCILTNTSICSHITEILVALTVRYVCRQNSICYFTQRGIEICDHWCVHLVPKPYWHHMPFPSCVKMTNYFTRVWSFIDSLIHSFIICIHSFLYKKNVKFIMSVLTNHYLSKLIWGIEGKNTLGMPHPQPFLSKLHMSKIRNEILDAKI